jgi:hypothetical protein
LPDNCELKRRELAANSPYSHSIVQLYDKTLFLLALCFHFGGPARPKASHLVTLLKSLTKSAVELFRNSSIYRHLLAFKADFECETSPHEAPEKHRHRHPSATGQSKSPGRQTIGSQAHAQVPRRPTHSAKIAAARLPRLCRGR